jgi:hypothetical protein
VQPHEGERVVVHGDLAADDEPHAQLLGRLERAHHPVEAVAVGHAEGVVPEPRRALDERPRGRASTEE